MGLGSRPESDLHRSIEIYAVIRSGGKQYRVERDQLLDVDLIKGDVGSTVELKDVLLVGNNGDVTVGTPTVEGAVVEAEIVEHGRDKKLRVFKYKAKTRYRRRIGHRTHYTRLSIKRILQDGKEAAGAAEQKPRAKAKRPTRRPKKAEKVEAKAEETAVEAAAEATAEAPAAEADAKPKRATRRKAAKATTDAPGTEAKPKRASRRTTQRKPKKADDAPEAEASAEAEPKRPARKRSTTAKAEDKPARTARRRTTKPKAEAGEEKTDEEPGG